MIFSLAMTFSGGSLRKNLHYTLVYGAISYFIKRLRVKVRPVFETSDVIVWANDIHFQKNIFGDRDKVDSKSRAFSNS